jgi:small redox-active disulfide protein 2
MITVKVLGTGCPKCNKLYQEAEKAVQASGVEASLEKVEKLDDIMGYGVMMTPALVVDEQVKCAGKIAKSAEIAGWIAAAAGEA